MVLDGGVKTEPVEQKPFVQLLPMKKVLEVPSMILLAGAAHLKGLKAETRGHAGGQRQEDFH